MPQAYNLGTPLKDFLLHPSATIRRAATSILAQLRKDPTTLPHSGNVTIHTAIQPVDATRDA